MSIIVDSRIKVPDVGISSLQTEFEIKIVEHNSSNEYGYVLKDIHNGFQNG